MVRWRFLRCGEDTLRLDGNLSIPLAAVASDVDSAVGAWLLLAAATSEARSGSASFGRCDRCDIVRLLWRWTALIIPSSSSSENTNSDNGDDAAAAAAEDNDSDEDAPDRWCGGAHGIRGRLDSEDDL